MIQLHDKLAYSSAEAKILFTQMINIWLRFLELIRTDAIQSLCLSWSTLVINILELLQTNEAKQIAVQSQTVLINGLEGLRTPEMMDLTKDVKDLMVKSISLFPGKVTKDSVFSTKEEITVSSDVDIYSSILVFIDEVESLGYLSYLDSSTLKRLVFQKAPELTILYQAYLVPKSDHDLSCSFDGNKTALLFAASAKQLLEVVKHK